ncbi:NAD(P)H-dependent glycerol-3-phosphate dehydrogenase [Beijerinckia sp. L45]|uniref:NAD(P)H-dependent glycerol-3-phosphate dehydrogenase n=1 Tax=Beijerinckia sp. L45 TaxID=1641855 RepID=UPI00131B84C3|nr:NAD(P)H-dependent glycerol-3-phosphate dehydrogenase [Beijerinckia sp. L45]
MADSRRIAVLGGGAWGTALANLAARAGADVTLWAREPGHVAEMAATGVNARRLPGVPLHAAITPTGDLATLEGADIVLLAVPAQSLRRMAEQARPFVAEDVPVVVCAKGIERSTGLFMSDVIAAVLPNHPPAILSGPSFAEDVARGMPTAVTLAARDADGAEALAAAFAAPWFRLYHSADIRGVEIGGAVKNVLAIASGIAAGRGLGQSAGAALIARGFAEMTRFGMAYGADPGTLMGLAGLGDLVLTCSSTQSRNYSFGVALGQGMSVADATAQAGTVEGAQTCPILVDLAARKGVDMPIAQAVDAVLSERSSVETVITALLARPAKAEAKL